MTSPSSPPPRPRAASTGSPGATLLADPATRAIVAHLGAAGAGSLDATQIAGAVQLSLTGRLVRDRLRILERRGVVVATSRAASDGSAPTRWALTDAGRDLHRLLSLITRITAHAARLPEASGQAKATDAVVGCTLSALDDPIVRTVARQLGAASFLEPLELEAACTGIPRRTLYRRLGPLVDAGAILRETTRQVPRSTRYALVDRWRPVVAVLVLIAWWESRHPGAASPPADLDLAGAMTIVSPRVRPRRGGDAVVRWVVAEPGARFASFDTATADGAVVTRASDAATPTATVRAPLAAWTAALVEGSFGPLEITGDAAQAEAMLAAFRAALLAYVR
ncbi:MAG: winged helix-turn-helix transcriptional regulator [Patulibacter minatonensis]